MATVINVSGEILWLCRSLCRPQLSFLLGIETGVELLGQMADSYLTLKETACFPKGLHHVIFAPCERVYFLWTFLNERSTRELEIHLEQYVQKCPEILFIGYFT